MVNLTALEPVTQTGTTTERKPKARARYTWTRTVGKPQPAHTPTPDQARKADALPHASEARLRTIENALKQVAAELKQAGHTQAAHMVRGRAFALYEVRMASVFSSFDLPFKPTEDASCVDVSAYVAIK
jgi:hypothetical protein